MPVRGIRGATTSQGDSAQDVLARTRELLMEMQKRNAFEPPDLAAVIFTTTTDLDAAFPATAARELGWRDAATICAHEIDVPGGLPHCIRVLILWNTDRPVADIHHVYLHEAESLRPDRAEPHPAEQHPARTYPLPASIAFQGEHGAFSEEALLQALNGEVDRVPCRTFEEIFLAVSSGRTEAGLLPVENSTTGSIHTSYDLLLENDLNIIGELILPGAALRDAGAGRGSGNGAPGDQPSPGARTMFALDRVRRIGSRCRSTTPPARPGSWRRKNGPTARRSPAKRPPACTD